MLISDIFIVIGFLFIALVPYLYNAYVGRFICGFGTGISSFAVPLYLSEVSPHKWHKEIVSSYGVFISLGLVTGLNLSIPYRHHWKTMFELGIVPAGLQVLILIFMPETQGYYV